MRRGRQITAAQRHTPSNRPAPRFAMETAHLHRSPSRQCLGIKPDGSWCSEPVIFPHHFCRVCNEMRIRRDSIDNPGGYAGKPVRSDFYE